MLIEKRLQNQIWHLKLFHDTNFHDQLLQMKWSCECQFKSVFLVYWWTTFRENAPVSEIKKRGVGMGPLNVAHRFIYLFCYISEVGLQARFHQTNIH